jgi:hypothetical protein
MLLKGRYSRKGRRSKPTVRNEFTGVVLAAACKSSERFQSGATSSSKRRRDVGQYAAPGRGLGCDYNGRMDDRRWSRDELLKEYEAGVWIFLIILAAAILGLIFWLGYEIFL